MKIVNKEVYSKRDDQSGTGIVIDANQLIAASFHIVPGKNDDAGTLIIQASNDLNTSDSQNFVPTNWVLIPNMSATITSGGQALLTLPAGMSYRWLRVSYTASGGGSSTTLMKVRLMAQSV